MRICNHYRIEKDGTYVSLIKQFTKELFLCRQCSTAMTKTDAEAMAEYCSFMTNQDTIKTLKYHDDTIDAMRYAITSNIPGPNAYDAVETDPIDETINPFFNPTYQKTQKK